MDTAPESKPEVPQGKDGEEGEHAPAIDPIKPVKGAAVWRDIWDDRFVRFLTSIGIGFWILHELVPDSRLVFLYLAYAFSVADGFFVVGFKLMPSRWWIKSIFVFCYFTCLFVVFLFKNSPESIDSRMPVLSQKTFQLGDGTYSFQSGATVFNPSDFPIFNVEIWFYIKGKGIKADSVLLAVPPPKSHETKPPWSEFTLRSDYLHDPTNQTIQFVVGEIPANGHFYFEISGADSKKGFVEAKVTNYSTNSPQVLHSGNTNIFYYPVVVGQGTALLITNFHNGIKTIVTNLQSVNTELKPIIYDDSGGHVRFENY